MNPVLIVIGVAAAIGWIFKANSDEAVKKAETNAEKSKAEAEKLKADADSRAQEEEESKRRAQEEAEAAKAKELRALREAVIAQAGALMSVPFKYQRISAAIDGKPIGLMIQKLVESDTAEKKDYFVWLTALDSEKDRRADVYSSDPSIPLIASLKRATYDYGIKLFGMDASSYGPAPAPDAKPTEKALPAPTPKADPVMCRDLSTMAAPFQYQKVWPGKNGVSIGPMVLTYLLDNPKATKADFDLIIKMLREEFTVRSALPLSLTITESIGKLGKCLEAERARRFP